LPAEIVFIGLVGECLESLTFERTQRAIQRIAEVSRAGAGCLRDGQEVRVFTGDVQAGDCVLVKRAAKCPLMRGHGRGSAVDQSARRESLPVERNPAMKSWPFDQSARRLDHPDAPVAQQTVAGRVIELTRRRSKDKAPLERTADKLARFSCRGSKPGHAHVSGKSRRPLAGAAPTAKLGWGDVSPQPLSGSVRSRGACPCALI